MRGRALLLAARVQLEPPPPLGEPDGERAWGGAAARDGPAVCPLVPLIIPPTEDGELEAARAAGRVNALLGRPSRGSVDVAIRCVAACDLPAGALIVSDLPGAAAAAADGAAVGAAAAAPVAVVGDRVRVVVGPLNGLVGTVVSVGAEGSIVRLDGSQKKLKLSAEKLQVVP